MSAPKASHGAATVISTLSSSCVGARATSLADPSAILAALQAKAEQAQPRDKCFLYAELVNHMTDLADRQLNSGDYEQASKTLELFQGNADKIHLDISDGAGVRPPLGRAVGLVDSRNSKMRNRSFSVWPFVLGASSTKLRMQIGRISRRR
jgi:hypothetical protein